MKFQLYVVCLFALFSIVLTLTSEEQEEQEDRIAENCMKQTNANDDDMEILDGSGELAETRTQFCLLACFNKGLGIMDANNKLIYEQAVTEFESFKEEDKEYYDQLDQILKECIASTTPDNDECDSMKKYQDCMAQRADNMGIDY